MRRTLAVSLVVGFIAVLGIGRANAAGNLTCNSSTPINGGTYTNVTVPAGGQCYLFGVTVTGNVTAGPNSILQLQHTGVQYNVYTTSTDLVLLASTVHGNVFEDKPIILQGIDVATICDSTIDHNLTVQNAPANTNTQIRIGTAGAGCTGSGLNIGGNATITNNGVPVLINNTTVAGTLYCSGNTSVTGSGNTAGSKVGQCATV